jgi:hypothetical protein
MVCHKRRKEKRPIWGRVLLAQGFQCLSSLTFQAFINCMNEWKNEWTNQMFSIEVTQHKRTLLNRLGSHYQNKFGVFGLAYEQLIYRHKHLKHKIVDEQLIFRLILIKYYPSMKQKRIRRVLVSDTHKTNTYDYIKLVWVVDRYQYYMKRIWVQ